MHERQSLPLWSLSQHRRRDSRRARRRAVVAMQPFSYVLAADVRSASTLALDEPRSRFLAGGTTLVDLMKLDVEQPTQLIDITRLPLAEVTLFPDGALRIGAMVRNADLAHNEFVRTRFPM